MTSCSEQMPQLLYVAGYMMNDVGRVILKQKNDTHDRKMLADDP